MLFTPGLSDFGFSVDNWGADASTSVGTSVVPGATNAEGAWTQVLTALAQDVFFSTLVIHSGTTSTAAKNHLLDIGVDPAGGTSYTAVVSNFTCGASALTSGGARHLVVPLFIKAGSTVAVRVQGSNATAGTMRVGIKAYGQPARPELLLGCSYSETLGTITNSNGTSFTPGNAADGAYVSLGTIVKPAKWVQLGCQIDNAAMSAHHTYIDLAVGDASNKRVLIRTHIQMTTVEAITEVIPGNLGWCAVDLPAGAELWIRGRNNNAPVTGYNGVAVIFGG